MGDEGCDDARASLLSHESEPEWAQVAGMASDLVVTIGQRAFHVLQYPLFSLSTVIASAAAAADEGTGPTQADLSFLPGGALSFVPIACYCYARPCRLSPHSMLLVRSAASLLEMNACRSIHTLPLFLRLCKPPFPPLSPLPPSPLSPLPPIPPSPAPPFPLFPLPRLPPSPPPAGSIAAGDERVWVQPRTATASAGNAAPAAPPAALPALPACALVSLLVWTDDNSSPPLACTPAHSLLTFSPLPSLSPTHCLPPTVSHLPPRPGQQSPCPATPSLNALPNSQTRLHCSLSLSPLPLPPSPQHTTIKPCSISLVSSPDPATLPLSTHLLFHLLSHACLCAMLRSSLLFHFQAATHRPTPPHSGCWGGAASVSPPTPPCPCERMLPLSHAVPRHASRRSSRLFLYQPVPQP
ncbi:unnamed protein product [Closterium sp. Naga37s-1]|nr:unnamed protein product [Closterium sp. Naga37s-1]